ncbi:hypothetical protein DLJ59_24685 [Micromonospora inaquosa]|uniref:Uncharacterized protein n=1 Tax=Micromonospora inaquosa TaxID=2203716 RepID=A0A3N9WES5_9ACTN|nr:hypothetical protein DLJ59_24685 [Micromonospora inaquosa]
MMGLHGSAMVLGVGVGWRSAPRWPAVIDATAPTWAVSARRLHRFVHHGVRRARVLLSPLEEHPHGRPVQPASFASRPRPSTRSSSLRAYEKRK